MPATSAAETPEPVFIALLEAMRPRQWTKNLFVFPATVAHASLNGPGAATLSFLRARNDLTTGLTGLLGQGVMLVFVVLLWRLLALRSDQRTDGGVDHA